MCIPIKSRSEHTPLKDIITKLTDFKINTTDKPKPSQPILESLMLDSKTDFQHTKPQSKAQQNNGSELTIPLFEDIKEKATETLKAIKPITVDDVKSGTILGKDMQGPAVKILKDRLQAFTGTKLPVGDKFDSETEKFVKIVQKNLGICKENSPNYGKIDNKTWMELNNAMVKFPGNSIPLTKQAEKFADEAKNVANSMNTHGNCYAGVWTAIQNQGLDKKMNPPADHAYQFGEWAMTKQGKNVLSRVMPLVGTNGQLMGLKPGDIIVYDRGVNYHSTESGHIEVYKSNKEFYSDHNSCDYAHGGYNDLMKDIKNGDLLDGSVKIFRLNPPPPAKPKQNTTQNKPPVK